MAKANLGELPGLTAAAALLIPLYAVGVFLSFTLSQAGMVRASTRAMIA